jgi:molybdopterin synthase sulfur carrier subunit
MMAIGYKIQVTFFATLRQIVGQKTVDFSINEGSTVRQLIDEIIRCYPGLERELIDEHGELYEHNHVIINGRDINFLDQGIETVITSKDRVSVFPAIGGG